jgi:MFS family permease
MKFLPASFAALSGRPFRLFWAGQALSAIGDGMIGVALAFAVIDLTGSAADLGIVFAAGTVPRVLLTLAAGVWADRLPRNAVMRASDAVRALVQGAIAVDLITGHAEIWHLAVGAAVYGSAASFFGPAMTGIVPDLVAPAHLQQANALLSLTRTSVRVGGPALSGLLVVLVGSGWVFAIDALTFVGSAIFLSLVTIPPALVAVRSAFVRELVDGWREVRQRDWLWASLISFALGNMVVASYLVLGPLAAERHYSGATTWGLWGTAFMVGGVLGAAAALRVSPARPLVFTFGVWCLAALQPLLLGVGGPSVTLVAAALAAGFALEISNALWYTVVQQQIPRASLSRVTAYDWMVSWLFMPLGYALAGPVAAAVGERPTLLGAGLLQLVANLAVIALVPGIRRIRLRPAVAG